MDECEGCAGTVNPNEPREVAALLGNLVAGDLFHGSSTGGASLICIVTRVDDTRIYARRFTTGEDLIFDRVTGALIEDEHRRSAWIDTVEPLPIETHNVFLAMDRRYRLGRTFERVRLTPEEIAAMQDLDRHVNTHAFRRVDNDKRIRP